MVFYLLSGIVPLLFIGIMLWFNKPLSKEVVVRTLMRTLLPLFTYILLMYYLESENFVNEAWIAYTVFFFFVPYLVIVLIARAFIKVSK